MANKIAFYREQRGMTQDDLAEAAGLSVEIVKAAEASTEIPLLPDKAVPKIADALGISDIRDLFPYKPDMAYQDLKTYCGVIGGDLQSVLNTIYQARIQLQEYGPECAEYDMILTAELALESIIQKLKEAENE